MGILKHDPEGTSKICFFDLIDIDAVVPDLSVLNIIEAVDQIGDRRLTRSGGTDKRDLLSRFRIQLHIVEHDLVIVITEIHAVKHDISFQLHIIDRLIRLMYMFPCPSSGPFLTLFEFSVFFSHIDKRHISLIHFRLFIQKLENTFRSCQRHNDRIHLLADLIDRHAEAFVKGQETCKPSQGKSSDAVQRQNSADDRTDNVADISELRVDRT